MPQLPLIDKIEIFYFIPKKQPLTIVGVFDLLLFVHTYIFHVNCFYRNSHKLLFHFLTHVPIKRRRGLHIVLDIGVLAFIFFIKKFRQAFLPVGIFMQYEFYPLTEPPVIPTTYNFCKKINNRTTGTAIRIDPAAKQVKNVFLCVLSKNSNSPIATV